MKRFFTLLNNDRDRQIRPILAQLVWRHETAAPPVPCDLELSYAVMFIEGVLTRSEREFFLNHMGDCRYCRLFVAREVRSQRPAEQAQSSVPSSRALRFRWWPVAAATCVICALASWQLWSGRFSASETQSLMSSLHRAEVTSSLTPPALSPESTSQTALLRQGVAGASKRLNKYRKLVSEAAKGRVMSVTPTVRRLFRVDAATDWTGDVAVASINQDQASQSKGWWQTAEYTVQVVPLKFQAADTASRKSPELRVAVLSPKVNSLEPPAIQLPQRKFMPKDFHSEIKVVPSPSSLAGFALSFMSRNNDAKGQRTGSAESSQYVYIGGKRFRVVDRVLIDTELTSTLGHPIVKLKRQSSEMRGLMKEQPGLQAFFQVDRDLVLLYEGTVYITY